MLGVSFWGEIFSFRGLTVGRPSLGGGKAFPEYRAVYGPSCVGCCGGVRLSRTGVQYHGRLFGLASGFGMGPGVSQTLWPPQQVFVLLIRCCLVGGVWARSVMVCVGVLVCLVVRHVSASNLAAFCQVSSAGLFTQ